MCSCSSSSISFSNSCSSLRFVTLSASIFFTLSSQGHDFHGSIKIEGFYSKLKYEPLCGSRRRAISETSEHANRLRKPSVQERCECLCCGCWSVCKEHWKEMDVLVHRSFQCEIWQQSSLSKMHVSGLCRLNDEPVTNDVSIWEHGMSSHENNDRTQYNKVEHLDAQSWRHAPILRAHVQPCNWIKDPYI